MNAQATLYVRINAANRAPTPKTLQFILNKYNLFSLDHLSYLSPVRTVWVYVFSGVLVVCIYIHRCWTGDGCDVVHYRVSYYGRQVRNGYVASTKKRQPNECYMRCLNWIKKTVRIEEWLYYAWCLSSNRSDPHCIYIFSIYLLHDKKALSIYFCCAQICNHLLVEWYGMQYIVLILMSGLMRQWFQWTLYVTTCDNKC